MDRICWGKEWERKVGPGMGADGYTKGILAKGRVGSYRVFGGHPTQPLRCLWGSSTLGFRIFFPCGIYGDGEGFVLMKE
jgi:hypothetical protein